MKKVVKLKKKIIIHLKGVNGGSGSKSKGEEVNDNIVSEQNIINTGELRDDNDQGVDVV